jgi:hypothetical protein
MYLPAATQLGFVAGGSLPMIMATNATTLSLDAAWASATTFNLNINGALAAEFTTAQFYTAGLGTVAAPAHSFAADLSYGMYLPAATQLGFVAGGSLPMIMATNATTLSLDAAWGAATTFNLNINGALVFELNAGQSLTNFGITAAPGMSFIGDADTGFRRSASGTVIFVSNGVDVLTMDAGGISGIISTSTFGDGTAAAPSITFTSDTNTGVYRVGADNIGISAGGTLRLGVSTTAVTSTLPFVAPAGTAALPAYVFTGDLDTGMYLPAAGTLGLSADGTAGISLISTLFTCLIAGSFSSTLAVTGIATFSAAVNTAQVALTDAASIATNAALANAFTVTLAGNRTLDNPTNLVAGSTYIWKITQDATGGRTLAFGSVFSWPGGSPPVMTAIANAVDVISAYYDGTKLRCNVMLDLA